MRSARKWLLAVGIVVLVVIGFAMVRKHLNGPELGSLIGDRLNAKMRGRVEIGSVEWPSDALQKLATGGWVPVVMHDVKVWDDCALSSVTEDDPDELRTGDPNDDCTPNDQIDPTGKRRPRRLLLRSDLLTADIDIHALVFEQDFVFRNLWVHGGWGLVEEVREPYPMHAYERKIVSMVTAFYPRMKAGFRAGIYADEKSPIFDLRDIHMEHVNLLVHVGPSRLAHPRKGLIDPIEYTVTARIDDVNIDADASSVAGDRSYVYMDPTDPLVQKFYFRLAASGKSARVRVFDDGDRANFRLPLTDDEVYPPIPAPRDGITDPKELQSKFGRNPDYDITLSDVRVDRVAQLPTDWAKKDYVANSLELVASAKTAECIDDPADPQYVLAANEHADLKVSGEILNWWDRPYDGTWNLKLEGTNLGPTIHHCIKHKISGDDVHGSLTLSGPYIAMPKVEIDLKNLDYTLNIENDEDPLPLTLAEVHGSIDLVNDTGKLEKTRALVRNGKDPGELDIAALFAFSPYSGSVSVDIIKPIDASRFLPKKLRAATGAMLMGHLHAFGDADYGFALDELDLSLGPSALDRAVRVHKGRVFTKDNFATIDIENVQFQAGRSHATVHGSLDTVNNALHQLTIDDIEAPDLDVWLNRLGLPAIAKGAGGGKIVIDGNLSDPTVDIDTRLSGVPCLDKVALHGIARGDILDIPRISTSAFGGELSGNARLRLGDTTVIEKLHLAGGNLAVARMCGLAGIAKGTLDSAELDLHGSIDKTRSAMDWMDLASATIKARHLEVYGEGYTNILVCLNRKDDALCRPRAAQLDDDDLQQCADAKQNGFCAVMSATRDAGGKLDATVAKKAAVKGKKPIPAKLGGTIKLEDVPMAVLDRFLGTGTAGGLLSATLHLAGTPDAPQATGAVQLLRGWAMGGFIGDSQLAIEPTTLDSGAPGIKLSGAALAGRLGITAHVGTAPPYPVDLNIVLRRIELDPFVDLAAIAKSPDPIEAWTSGTIKVQTELAPLDGKPPHPDAWVELTELEATVAHRAVDGRLIPLTISAKPQKGRPAVSIHATPDLLELACRDGRVPCTSVLATPLGDIELQGHATTSEVTLAADGTFDFAKVKTLLDATFEDIGGKATFSARVTGTIKQPSYEVGLELSQNDKDVVHAQLAGTDTVIKLPKGLIKLANGALGFSDVTIAVADTNKEEQSHLVVHGAIKLDGLDPAAWGVFVEGRLAGKLLTVLAPTAVSQATGAATIGPADCPPDEDGTIPETCGALTLTGRGKLPLVDGTLTFRKPPTTKGEATNLAIIPRGVRRELEMIDGSLDIATDTSGDHRTYRLYLGGATMRIDGVGEVDNIIGPIELRDGTPAFANVQFSAHNIPFKLPGTLDLTLDAQNITISYDEGQGLRIGCTDIPDADCGGIQLISGTFQKDLDILGAVVPTGPATGPSKPFWDEYPTIGAAQVALQLEIRNFEVKNNIANPIAMHGTLGVSGQVKDIGINGNIFIDRGQFRLPGTRASFTRTSGTVSFDPSKPAGDPALNIESSADYRDLQGQDHVITLTITGQLAENPSWDLRTSTGYNKAQTLALLVLGRNPEQLRRSLGDQSIGANPTIADPTSTSTGVTDQLVKDLSGQLISDLLGNSLRLSIVDVLRFEVGFGSIGVHAEKKWLENITLIGDAEQTTSGNTINGRIVVRTPYRALRLLSGLVGGRLQLPEDPVELQYSYLRKNFVNPAEQDIADQQVKLVYRLAIP